MTDRAEIERLLNQTGRTLEGLPELYPLKDCEDAIKRSGCTVGMAGNMICHQSDVIELLVGALRDALDKPKNRPFSKEEIEDSIYVIPCVIEEKNLV